MNSPRDLDIAVLIIQIVCRHFACTCDDLETRGPRASLFDWPRYLAVNLIHQNTNLSLTIIGLIFDRTLPETITMAAPEAVRKEFSRSNEFSQIAAAFHAASPKALAA